MGIGTCTDKDLVIPEKSPAGDTVTLIDEYAFYSLEDVESVTLLNANYEVDKNAFQYGEFTTLNIIGGSPVIKKSAFSSCEDLTSISFSDCNIQADEYAFYSCGDSANVEMNNCSITLDERVFQYSSLESLTITGAEVEMGTSAFSSCEDLTTIKIDCSIVTLGEYVFSGCADNLTISIAGTNYTADSIKDGLK